MGKNKEGIIIYQSKAIWFHKKEFWGYMQDIVWNSDHHNTLQKEHH